MSDQTSPTGATKGPLHGVRVVEFGWVLAGTLPGLLLSDLGAEVIKVESARRLDLNRSMPPLHDRAPVAEQNPRFHALNRGKLGITLDLQAPASRDVMQRLVTDADVVVENFSPGVLDKAGFGYPELAKWRPDLIMASVSAAGQTGPWSHARGYALTVGALSGFSSLTGYEGESPLGDEFMGPDVIAALHATVAILAALHHRKATGEGQYIDVSMLEAMTAILAEPVLETTVAGRTVLPQSADDPSLSPQGVYRCAGDDAWVAISIRDEAEWLALCAAMQADDLATDPDLRDRYGRRCAAADIHRRIGEWTSTLDKFRVATTLQSVGVAAAPVLDLREHLEDPTVAMAGVYVQMPHPALEDDEIIATPWSSQPQFAMPRFRAPLLGEHNEQVLCDLLGFSADEYQRMQQSGALR